MKPEGCALDIAVVGLGQAGGNLAAEFARRGYRAMALNTAEADLAALDPGGVFPSLPEDQRLFIGAEGYDGAGSDPAYGRDCLREHAERIRSAVVERVDGADAVVLCAGLGGGTGSALPALVEILGEADLPLVALMTLPTPGESGLAKVNAVRAIQEVVHAPLSGWVLADNARLSELHTNVPFVDYFAHVNAEIVNPLDALNRLSARADLSPIRSFDGEDFRKLLLAGGMLNYAAVELATLDVDAVLGGVIGAIESSDIMPAGFDVGRLSYLGIILEAPERALEGVSFQTFERIATELKAQTGGAAIYQGIYRSGSEGPTTLRILATTPSLPARLQEIVSDARREGQLLGEKVAEVLPDLEVGDISNLDLFRTKARPSARPTRRAPAEAARRPVELLEDIADEVASAAPRHRRAPPRPTPPKASPPPPEAAAARPPPPSQNTEPVSRPRRSRRRPHDEASSDEDKGGTDDRQTNLGRSEPPVSTEGVDTGDLPDPNVYDGLVTRFLEAEDDAEREAVIRRLETDAGSDITVVRYYAVEAMAKLGRRVFGEALERARSDVHEAVRTLAAAALEVG